MTLGCTISCRTFRRTFFLEDMMGGCVCPLFLNNKDQEAPGSNELCEYVCDRPWIKSEYVGPA